MFMEGLRVLAREELTEKEDMRMVVMRLEVTACALGLALTMLVEIATHKLAEEGGCCEEAMRASKRCSWML